MSDASGNDAEGDGNVQVEETESSGITDPRESDVLCGRGGAALRHPGNQTYRRLVNLNKGLYITCLKTEKLKISRSIVAAIREQRGRFLEKDSKSGTWFDIGTFVVTFLTCWTVSSYCNRFDPLPALSTKPSCAIIRVYWFLTFSLFAV